MRRVSPQRPSPKDTIKVRRRPIQEGDRIPIYVDVKLVRDLDGGRSVTVMLNGQRITLDERYLDRAD